MKAGDETIAYMHGTSRDLHLCNTPWEEALLHHHFLPLLRFSEELGERWRKVEVVHSARHAWALQLGEIEPLTKGIEAYIENEE